MPHSHKIPELSATSSPSELPQPPSELPQQSEPPQPSELPASTSGLANSGADGVSPPSTGPASGSASPRKL
ncbi:hypothetical protein ACRALDRAFT_1059747, partial [Sodiomyces alcalophilus JCM 7366]|uniref:uncharacterized protein n=1 Tax=Sodiomyces alcalophilus JCM 7366 TaxID=591952 RepID=UPI0039B41BB9